MTSPTAFRSEYRGAKVLVTGHTGFKGTWLATWLEQMGSDVSGLALDPESGSQSLYSQSGLDGRIDSVIGDIRDLDTVRDTVLSRPPDIVFHLAAQALVRRSYRDPVGTIATNVMGTVNVLEACRHVPSVRAVIVVTSDKAYANPESGRPITEDRPMGGRDPYSASKGAAELITTAYRESFFAAADTALIASGRAGNVIGAGDMSEDRLVPDIVRAIRGKEPVVIRHPASTRPWQHVLEPLRGYLMLGARLLAGADEYAAGWNFGPNTTDAETVAELARRFIDRWGEGDLQIEPESGAPHEAKLLSLDITKARQQLGFEPLIDIPTAISYTVDGYRQLFDGDQPAQDVLLDQIASYEALTG